MAQITPLRAALAITLVAFAAIAGAWIFEAFGFLPCELCLKQRWAYYVGVPLAALTAAAASRNERLARPLLWLLALLFLASMMFGIYHAGVEWGFWPGPTGCTAGATSTGSMDDFLKQLQSAQVVPCDKVAIRILGLSLAGWNAVISAALAAVAIIGAAKRR